MTEASGSPGSRRPSLDKEKRIRIRHATVEVARHAITSTDKTTGQIEMSMDATVVGHDMSQLYALYELDASAVVSDLLEKLTNDKEGDALLALFESAEAAPITLHYDVRTDKVGTEAATLTLVTSTLELEHQGEVKVFFSSSVGDSTIVGSPDSQRGTGLLQRQGDLGE